MDINKMTRAQAERVISRAPIDFDLEQFLTHKNKHVRDKVYYKRMLPEERPIATGMKAVGCAFQSLDQCINRRGLEIGFLGRFIESLLKD